MSRVACCLAVLIVLSLLLLPGASAMPLVGESSSPRDRLIVLFEGTEALERLTELASDRGSTVTLSIGQDMLYWQGWNHLVKRAIERVPGVVGVDRERSVSILFTPDDSDYSLQWGVRKVNAEDAWDYTFGQADVVIAVLDTGIDYTHDDLTANMWRDDSGRYGYDFWNDDSDPMDDNIHGYDNNVWRRNMYIYHGTHVAGIAGAVMNNGIGIAGMAQASLMAVKVMNESGEGTDASVAEGIYYAVDQGAHIIVMSLGVDSSTMALTRAVRYASDNGVIMVAAAGNAGASRVAYPAAYPQVIAVGASDSQDRRASFSNYGNALEVVAPGTQIWSTKAGDQYQYLSGTSTATPFVAGLAALMLSVNPALTPSEVREAINQTAKDLGTPGWDPVTGWGRIDAYAAVTAVAGPAATIVRYPSTAEPNSTLTIEWVVSGANGLTIDFTYLRWGYSSDSMTNVAGESSGNVTPYTFQAPDIPTPPNEGDVLYLQAVAIIEGVEYTSRLVEIVSQTPSVDPFLQLMESIKRLVVEDIGLLNFALILVALIAVPVIIASVRARRRGPAVARGSAAGHHGVPPQMTQQRASPYHDQAAPPPPTVYVDIADGVLMPEVVEVDEGTRVVWRNMDWAPPPGISIVSGTVDARGARPDGLFASGLMISPGEYWSCTFNRRGYYPYYVSLLNLPGKVLVRSLTVARAGQY